MLNINMTPLRALYHQRHKAFHQAIARRAAMLRPAPAKPVEIVMAEPEPVLPPARPLFPPVPDHLMVEAHRVLRSPVWKGSIRKIQRAVCDDYGVSMTDLLSARRFVVLSMPRQVAMYLCKKLTTKSLLEIGRKFGNRDHTTVLHGVRKIERLLATDAELRARVDAIAEALGGVVE